MIITNSTDRGKGQVVDVSVNYRLDTEEEVPVYERVVYYNALHRTF